MGAQALRRWKHGTGSLPAPTCPLTGRLLAVFSDFLSSVFYQSTRAYFLKVVDEDGYLNNKGANSRW